MVEKKGLGKAIGHAFLWFGIAIVLFPLYIALVATTHTFDVLIGSTPLWFGGEFLKNFTTVLTQGLKAAGGIPVWVMMANSLVMALGIAIGKIAISITAAYAIVYFRFPGRELCFVLIFITLMMPVEVRIVPTFQVAANLNFIDSYLGLVLPLIASATATFLYRQMFMTIPAELLEAARIDGAGPWRFFVDVVLPLSRTNTAALFVVLFIYGWNQYLWPLLVTNQESMYHRHGHPAHGEHPRRRAGVEPHHGRCASGYAAPPAGGARYAEAFRPWPRGNRKISPPKGYQHGTRPAQERRKDFQ